MLRDCKPCRAVCQTSRLPTRINSSISRTQPRSVLLLLFLNFLNAALTRRSSLLAQGQVCTWHFRCQTGVGDLSGPSQTSHPFLPPNPSESYPKRRRYIFPSAASHTWPAAAWSGCYYRQTIRRGQTTQVLIVDTRSNKTASFLAAGPKRGFVRRPF
jgi:hypothetical protein